MFATPTAGSGRARGRSRRWPTTAAFVVVVLTVLLASCTTEAAAPPPPPPPINVKVVHDGATTAVRVRKGRTVGDAVEKAKVQAEAGQELSVVTKKPLGPNGNEPTHLIDGSEVDAAEVLRGPTTIEVVNGVDTTEPTKVVRRDAAPSGLPNALQYVQFAGSPAIEEVTVGTKSNEVVATTPIEAGTPAHRATGKVLSLTFDDGPDPRYTPKVLDILKAKGVPAVFCQIGTSVQAHPELSKRILAEGHQLCNHTLHHVEGLETKPRETVEAEMAGGREAITAAVGEPPPFYRPPGGSLGPVIYDVAAANNEVVLYWAIDPRDWQRPPAGEIAADVEAQMRPGGIILLHDGGGDRAATLEALPAIIDRAKAAGYTFVVPISGRPQVG